MQTLHELELQAREETAARGVDIPVAIPRCLEWRLANPETRDCPTCNSIILKDETTCLHCGVYWDNAAPYCCSAYCARCATLRELDEEPQITPNEWMDPNGTADPRPNPRTYPGP